MSTWDDKPNDYEHALQIIERLRKDKALLVELVMDGELKPMTKCCVAIVIRDGGLAPTPLVTAWVDKVVARLNQQSRE